MGMRDHIEKLYKKYHTIDPYELADCLNIIVQRMDLGNMRGFYYNEKRIKQIFLNVNLPHHIEKFVLAHEIGHAILHPNCNAPFLNSTSFSVNKLEIEANKFAVLLIIPDVELMDNEGMSIQQISSLYGLPAEIIELRLKEKHTRSLS